MDISVIILTKNEERNIKKAIKSVSFCNEIIVIDDDSTDKTIELAKSEGAKVYERKSNGDFAAQRNWAMEKAIHDWILYIDADEAISIELRKEIADIKMNFQHSAYLIKRRDYWWSREMKYGETQKARSYGIIRMMKKGSGTWMGKVHEEFEVKSATNETHRLNGYIDHYPHPTLREFIEEINYYSSLRAKELKEQKIAASIFSTIFFPFFKFILTYFLYLGFLDGPPGFAYAFMMSFHSFLVRAKLYQYTKI